MKAHTPVMYAGSEQSSNGEGWARLAIIPWGGVIKKNVHNVCILFNFSRRKSVVVRDLNIANCCMFWLSVTSAAS